MTELLLEIHDEEKAAGGMIPDAAKRTDYEKRYHPIIKLGLRQNKQTKFLYAANQERALLKRLHAKV
ncbi:MAG: hypothetical protein HDQ87_09980 [Clostridia bacterium]|nr:hypothetical protein [Clostridia bacterium]